MFPPKLSNNPLSKAASLAEDKPNAQYRVKSIMFRIIAEFVIL